MIGQFQSFGIEYKNTILTKDFFLIRFTLLIILVIFPFSLYAQNIDLVFEHISTEQGLSEGSIYAILQDDKGFLWIGTKDGLNKYDGYNFTYFKSDPSDSSSLSDNHVYSIMQDSHGTMWIGTFLLFILKEFSIFRLKTNSLIICKMLRAPYNF